MAEAKKVEEVKEVKPSSKFYRSKIAGLKVLVKDSPNGDPTLVEYERFKIKSEKYQGDWVKVGYLKTDNKVVIDKLVGDSNVEEITEKEYTEAVNK